MRSTDHAVRLTSRKEGRQSMHRVQKSVWTWRYTSRAMCLWFLCSLWCLMHGGLKMLWCIWKNCEMAEKGEQWFTSWRSSGQGWGMVEVSGCIAGDASQGRCLGLKLLQSSHLLLLFMCPQFCGCEVIAVLYLSVLSDPRTMEIWEMGVHWGWENPSLGSYEWFHRLKRKFTQVSHQIRAVLSAFGFSMNRMKSERAIYWDFLWGAERRKLCSSGSLISLWG